MEFGAERKQFKNLNNSWLTQLHVHSCAGSHEGREKNKKRTTAATRAVW
jgi:hypothetical protein